MDHLRLQPKPLQFLTSLYVIEASLSEPHGSEYNGGFSYIVRRTLYDRPSPARRA